MPCTWRCYRRSGLCLLLVRRFIKWSQGNANTGSRRTELLPLLERCTRELQADERYRGDVRYLRVWIQYVRVGLRQAGSVLHNLDVVLGAVTVQATMCYPLTFETLLCRRTVCRTLGMCLRFSRCGRLCTHAEQRPSAYVPNALVQQHCPSVMMR